MKDNHISPIEAVESISRTSDRPLSGENISFDTATTPFSVDGFVLKLFNLRDDQAERLRVHNEADGLHVYIRLKAAPCRCDVCGSLTEKVKDYRIRKITHSVITSTPLLHRLRPETDALHRVRQDFRGAKSVCVQGRESVRSHRI